MIHYLQKGAQRRQHPEEQTMLMTLKTHLTSTTRKIFQDRVLVITVTFTGIINPRIKRGLSGGAKVLGKLPVPGRPIIWIQ